MPCCLRLLAIKVAPSTSLMLFLLLDRADADRRARCRQGPGPKKSPSADYAFMAMPGKRFPRRNSCHPATTGAHGTVLGPIATDIRTRLEQRRTAVDGEQVKDMVRGNRSSALGVLSERRTRPGACCPQARVFRLSADQHVVGAYDKRRASPPRHARQAFSRTARQLPAPPNCVCRAR